MKLSRILTLALMMAASVAQADLFSFDDFSVDQGPLSDLTTPGTADSFTGAVTDTLGIAPFRTLSTNLFASDGPVTNIVQVAGGALDITNGTSEDSQIISLVPMGPNSLPANIQNAFFVLDVIASDGDPTQMRVFKGGLAPGDQLGATAFIPGNTFNTAFTIGPLTNAEIASLQSGGDLHLVLDGAPGWDGTFDRFAISYEVAPEPGSLGLLSSGLIGVLALRRRRQRRS